MRRILLLITFVLVALGVWSVTHPRGRQAAARPASAAMSTEVAIQDRKTIDFSSGKPVVKDSAAEQAAIDRAVKQMDAAAAGVTFGPTPAAAAATTK